MERDFQTMRDDAMGFSSSDNAILYLAHYRTQKSETGLFWPHAGPAPPIMAFCCFGMGPKPRFAPVPSCGGSLEHAFRTGLS
jgi:hypothetical protein